MAIKGLYVTPKRLADGTIRYYYYAYRRGPQFWTSDHKRIDDAGKRLPAEFLAAYSAAMAHERKPDTGSLSATIGIYREKCAAFRKMKPKGKTARLKYLETWLSMPLHGGLEAGNAPLSVFDSRKVIKYITAFRDETWGHSPSAADEAVIALSAFLTWCRQDGRLDFNRAHGIEQVYQRPTKARVWTTDEQKRFLESAPWHLSRAFLLLLHTGLRREDLVSLNLSARRRQHLIVPTGKSGGRNTALLPITPPLEDLLSDLDEKRGELQSPPTTILFSSRGTPWTSEGFGTSFDKHRNRIGLGPKSGGPTIHDMRKTCATNLFILQQRYPEQITDQVFIDLFGWTPGTLSKMKRIYVSDDAVIDALTR